MILEEWREIDEFPHYAISDQGNVVNLTTDHVLKPVLTNSGYYEAFLSQKSKRYIRYIHRLVAQHFLYLNLDGMEVNHINGNKIDNRVINLEICTPRQNSQHAWDTGLKVSSDMKAIRIIETDQEFDSIRNCALFLKRAESSVSAAAKRGWKTAGYHIEFV